MQNLHCAFCGNPSLNAFEVVTKKKIFHYDICSECKGITLCKDDFLSKEEQKKRYLHHNNDLSNTGYVSFLGSFLENVFSFLRQKVFLKDETYFVQKHICDYGSGPRPVLVELLHVVSCMQRGGDGQKKKYISQLSSEILSYGELLARTLPLLPDVHCIQGWDPLFNQREKTEENDLVLCLEVAEHFENPREEFIALADSCKGGGVIALGTLPLPENIIVPEGFKTWWYKDDRTHVSFYTEKAAIACGKAAGLEYLGMASSRIFMFYKPEDA